MFHIKSKKVTKREDLDAAIAEMLASKEAYFLEVMVEKENNDHCCFVTSLLAGV